MTEREGNVDDRAMKGCCLLRGGKERLIAIETETFQKSFNNKCLIQKRGLKNFEFQDLVL